MNQYGAEDIKLMWDQDELDLEAYSILVNWFENEEIRTPKDSSKRIISAGSYKIQWIEKCHEMQRAFER